GSFRLFRFFLLRLGLFGLAFLAAFGFLAFGLGFLGLALFTAFRFLLALGLGLRLFGALDELFLGLRAEPLHSATGLLDAFGGLGAEALGLNDKLLLHGAVAKDLHGILGVTNQADLVKRGGSYMS